MDEKIASCASSVKLVPNFVVNLVDFADFSTKFLTKFRDRP
jgi:hypothetical protein